MATFKAVVRWPRSDGFYSVYIRVTYVTVTPDGVLLKLSVKETLLTR